MRIRLPADVVERLNRAFPLIFAGPRRGILAGGDSSRSDTCVACHQGQYAAANICPVTKGNHIWYGHLS
jgi:hypothetical protein